jgi:hypothetical protein
MKKAASVLEPMLKRLGIEGGVRLERIRKDWLTLFDESLSSHMYPARCAEGELLLYVDSPVWMQQLTFHKRDIVGRLSPYGITGVRFTLGMIPKKRLHRNDVYNVRTLSSEDMTFIAEAVSGIADKGLKDAVRRACERSLASGKNKGQRRGRLPRDPELS